MTNITHELVDKSLIENIKSDAKRAAKELLETAKLKRGSIVVVGCSTSETLGEEVGSWSVPEVGKAIFDGINSVFLPNDIYIAAQCCEHLNRAIVVERNAVPYEEIINVIPQPKAGGSFATAAYDKFINPVIVEEIKADAGIDIGGTLIGMHLKKVAVPIRLRQNYIGKAHVLCARVRPKYIGGERACYNEKLS